MGDGIRFRIFRLFSDGVSPAPASLRAPKTVMAPEILRLTFPISASALPELDQYFIVRGFGVPEELQELESGGGKGWI